MPRGRLAKALLDPDVDTVVYECPSKRLSSISVNVCNPNNFIVKINLAIVDGSEAVPLANDYLEKNTKMYAEEVLERTGLVLNTGQKIVARAIQDSGIIVNVYGFEEVRN